MFSPRALLFDMDGLLVDSEPLWYDVERVFALERGIDWTKEIHRPLIGRGLSTTLAFMAERFGVAMDLERDARLVIEALIERVGELELKPGAGELLRDARGCLPMALASSSSAQLIGAIVRRFELEPMFDAIVSGEAVARPKPAPDIFAYAAQHIGVDPRDCLVLEDSVAGCTAGRAAGMMVIAVPEGDPKGRGFEAVADAVVSDLFEARRYMRFAQS